MRSHDQSRRVEIRSPFDGTRQFATLRMPEDGPCGPLPLVIAPHPFGWSVDDDYHGGCQGLRADEHRGWLDVASDWGIAVLQPEGHHRAVAGCSMGYAGVVQDAPVWIDAVDEQAGVDRDRVYACGLSMGALEALLTVGSHPDLFAAAFAFNPVVDSRAWQEDLARTTSAELRAEGNDRLIAQEVGGLPEELPEAYAARSAFAVLDGLRSVPVTIWWSPVDVVVPRQAECHGKHLYDELKRLDPNAPVIEYDHTSRHGLPAAPTDDQRWAVHESSNYRLAADWLLLHRRASGLVGG